MRKIYQILIGLLFLVSGFLKALDSASFAQLIHSYGFSLENYLSPIIIGIEISIGLCWIFGVKEKSLSIITGFFTLILTVILIYGFQAKDITDCGCMGEFVKIPIWLSLGRNIVIVGLCFWIWKSSTSSQNPENWKLIVIYGISCIGFALAGLTTGVTIINKHNIKVGQRIEDTFLAQFKDKLSGKRAFAFVFSPTCPHCWNATENVKSIKQYELGEVIGIISEDTDAVNFVEAAKPNFEIFTIKTDSLKDNIKGVPLLVEFRDGKIEVIYKSGHIPSGAYLKQFSK